MGSLKEALTIERNRLFVGREAELAYMQNWLAQHDAPTEVVFISGMGGIGKSALMLQFLNMAQDENMLCIWLDGRLCTETPAGFLDSLQASLNQHSRTASASPISMLDIVQTMSRQRTFLCIDNYESLHQIESWLREVFLPQLPSAGVVVVLAARQDLAVDWQQDLAWRQRVRPLRLAPISRAQAEEFYSNIGLHKRKHPAMEKLIHETKGLPLAMALSAESVKLSRFGSEPWEWSVSMLVSAQLLREVATSDLQESLDLLCILPQANVEQLNRWLDKPLNSAKLHQLSRLSFVRPTVGGVALHDVARAHLLADFLHREPVRYAALRLRIVEEACKELKRAAAHEKRRLAAEVLSICRDSFLLGSISLITMNPDAAAMDLFRSDDLPHLHRLMIEQGQVAISLESDAKVHELLDSLAAQFPESIRVFRSSAGLPLAFTAGVLLYRDTFDFLEPFIPGVLNACLPQEAGRMKKLRLEEADTFYQLLGASAVNDSEYSFHELNAIMVTDHYARYSAFGVRFILVTKLEEIKEAFNPNIGFRVELISSLPEDHPTHGAYIYELDLRSVDFGAYVLFLLRASLNSGQAEAQQSTVTERDIKAALASLGSGSALETSELARKLNYSGVQLQQKLQTILHRDPPPFPLTGRKQQLLRLICEQPAMIAEMAAQRLHISRATYYRDRSEAVTDLIQLLSYK